MLILRMRTYRLSYYVQPTVRSVLKALIVDGVTQEGFIESLNAHSSYELFLMALDLWLKLSSFENLLMIW